jgi:hypothetical protein
MALMIEEAPVEITEIIAIQEWKPQNVKQT